MGEGIITVVALLRWRGQTLASIGWRSVFRGRALLARTLEVMGVTGAAMVLGGVIAGVIFGPPDTSAALGELSDNVWLFLFDIERRCCACSLQGETNPTSKFPELTVLIEWFKVCA